MGKHSQTKTINKKSNKIIKTICIICLLAVFVALIFILSKHIINIKQNVNNNGIKSEEQSEIINNSETEEQDEKNKQYEEEIKNTINSTFTALKNGKIEEVNKYLDYKKLLNKLDEEISTDGATKMSDLEKAFFEKLEWNIVNISIKNTQAIVNIEITNRDFKEILINWIQEETNIVKSGNDKSSLNNLKKQVTKTKNTRKVKKNITLNKKEEKWRILVDNNLENAVFPGIDLVEAAISEMN